MRLVKSSDPRARNAESSYSAEATVRKALESNRASLEGLDELLRDNYTINSNRDILDAVRNGDWVLVEDSSNAGGGGGFARPAFEPEPVYIQEDQWPDPKSRTDLIFAKSISTAPWGTTKAGTDSEPAANFGKTMVLASSTAEAGLGKIAGDLILRSFVWSLEATGTLLKNAAGPVGRVVILAMTPTMLGDGSFYSEKQLQDMRSATTRVRFQFRRDSQGALQIYGIHTSAQSGQDAVPVIKAKWNADKSAMEAHLGTITIIWTPNHGPLVTTPSTYPGGTDELANIMVHPISEAGDSKLEGAPIDEFKVEDCIITFPADSGIKSLYLVFAKPMVNPLEVGPANELSSRSAKDGLDIDHIPSQKALEAFLRASDSDIKEGAIQDFLRKAPSIAIPRRVHQKYSETYGGRNTKIQQGKDAADLRAAVRVTSTQSSLIYWKKALPKNRSKQHALTCTTFIKNRAGIDMNASMIDDLVKSLGRTYPEMISSGMYLPGGPPKGIFEDSDTLAMTPESGIELGFWASNQRFETLFISLLESFEEEPTYKGKLPYELRSRMTQGWIRSQYGEPFESRAPFKMPIRGMTGGTDTYRFANIPKGTQVVFKYNAEMNVETVVFRLIEKSHA